MAEIIPHSGLTLLDAHALAKNAGMHLIGNGLEVKISPIIPPGWREIPIKVRVTSPATGRVVAQQPTQPHALQVAA